MFSPGKPIRADDLNRLDGLAASGQLQSAGVGLYNNGSGVVPRNPRRAASIRTTTPVSVPQWRCSITPEGKLRVCSGQLAWGGCHSAVWPSGNEVVRTIYTDIEIEGAGLEVGDILYVMWYTKAAPVPLVNCPKRPNGPTPCGECGDCGTIGEAGDPSGFTPDRGAVGIFAEGARVTGWTDCRVLATLTKGADATYALNQIQTAEIAVNAIVYPGETGEDPSDPNPGDPPCGHPGNEPGGGGGVDEPGDEPGGGTDHPGDEPPGDDPGGGTDHPGDEPGGVTPPCGGDTVTP